MRKIILVLPLLSLLAFGAQTTETIPEPSTNVFAAQPWVLLTGTREVGFNWLTTVPANSWLEYRQSETGDWKSVFFAKHGLKDANTLCHKAYVRDYDARKPLYYRMVAREVIKFRSFSAKFQPEQRSKEGVIEPLVRPDGSFSVAVFQDIHSKNELYDPLLEKAGKDVTLCLSNGDPCHYFNSEKDIVERLCKNLAHFTHLSKMATYVRGNHETRGSHARYLPKYVTLRQDRYYGVANIGPARVLFLDSGDDRADWASMYDGSIAFTDYLKEEEEWLRQEVQSEAYKTAQWKVVFIHIPLKPCCGDKNLCETLFTNIAPVVSEARPDLVLGGHEHEYQFYGLEDAEKLGLHFPLYVGDSHPAEKSTVARLDVSMTNLNLKVLKADGTVVTNRCWVKAPKKRGFWEYVLSLGF